MYGAINSVKREMGKSPCGPAAVKVRSTAGCHWKTGKAQYDDEPKPEDLLTIVFIVSLREIGR